MDYDDEYEDEIIFDIEVEEAGCNECGSGKIVECTSCGEEFCVKCANNICPECDEHFDVDALEEEEGGRVQAAEQRGVQVPQEGRGDGAEVALGPQTNEELREVGLTWRNIIIS